jgi:hypothetical protein
MTWKKNTVKCLTVCSATTIGANAMFLQIDRRHTPFSVLHQFFLTLPITWAQVAAKCFCKIQDCDPSKLKKDVQGPNTRARATSSVILL